MDKIFCFLAAVAFILFLYAVFIEPYSLITARYKLSNSELSGIKIAFASDWHLSKFLGEDYRAEKAIDAINREKPDLVILGGDYVKGHKKSIAMPPEKIARLLKKIESPLVAVLGNHDSYYGKSKILQAFHDAEITVLDNKNTTLIIKNRPITLAGISDYYTDKPNIEAALFGAQKPLIFITHTPDILPQFNASADLILAGHTHGGQVVFPIIGALLVPSIHGQKYRRGLITEKNTPIIISSGLGTSLLPIRFNCVPEIAVVEFD